MKQRMEFSEPNSMTKYWNTSLFFKKNQGFWGSPGSRGVVMLFHMKELQLGLHKYMKMKLSISIIFFLDPPSSHHPTPWPFHQLIPPPLDPYHPHLLTPTTPLTSPALDSTPLTSPPPHPLTPMHPTPWPPPPLPLDPNHPYLLTPTTSTPLTPPPHTIWPPPPLPP